MNSVSFNKILGTIRKCVVSDDFTLLNIRNMNADQDLLIDRIRRMFGNIQFSLRQRDCCDLCAEEYENEKYVILSMIDDFMAGKLRNVSLTLTAHYMSTDKTIGFSVFIFELNGALDVQCYDKDVEGYLRDKIHDISAHELVKRSDLLLIDDFSLMELDSSYMYESEILSIGEKR